MTSTCENQNGFTLVELLIALTIFAVGILGVASMQLTSITGNGKANRVTEASTLVADQIETFLSLDYDDAALDDTDADGTNQDADSDGDDDDGGNFGLDDVTVASADGNAMSIDGNYQLFWNIAVDFPAAGMKTVNVIVDPPGAGRNVSMSIVKVD
ncbi:prepilin-type N-terminal cleavage/methylation domain-containing protein [uncultured Desulfuromusa sp.]|uniref:type IV pilus modification PilV family protein n=1 Tax=uncultured Desulfuromusa sp. TaxID=219183 RepID=UPI002AA82DD6|nr:prepilin-type N-terminal cleavage/methylation domain-containing protein [uncultured Desulfuromusa sp.]